MQSKEYIQTTFQHKETKFTYLAERSVDFPSTPDIGGTGMVLAVFRGSSELPPGMGKTIIFVDVTMRI